MAKFEAGDHVVYRGSGNAYYDIQYVGKDNYFVVDCDGDETIDEINWIDQYYEKQEPTFQVGKRYRFSSHTTDGYDFDVTMKTPEGNFVAKYVRSSIETVKEHDTFYLHSEVAV